MSHILVVDDEPAICWSLRESLTEEGHSVAVAGSVQQALTSLQTTRPDALIVDVRLPDADGIESLAKVRALLGSEVPVIVMTAFGDLETAVRAVQAGVFDYLTKPFNLDAATAVIERALASRRTEATEVKAIPATTGLLGISAAMQLVFKRIALVAASDTPVLITGESGTGKEEVALAIHRHSQRAAKQFIPVVVGALNETIVESELFGHVKGAFTGADNNRTGLLELANGGTVFLDEVGDIPLPTQVKLLRAIERKEVTPVGNPVPRLSDFRVLAATHRPLNEMVREGSFREDLLYRIRVFEIVVPPLRDRPEDIPLLAEHFLRQLPGRVGRTLSEAVTRELQSRPWYGNVRELRNAVEHGAVLARDTEIRPDHLPRPLSGSTSSKPADRDDRIRSELRTWATDQFAEAEGADNPELYAALMKLVEPPVLQAILERTGGNRVAAAKYLGIHRSTLREKLRDDQADHT